MQHWAQIFFSIIASLAMSSITCAQPTPVVGEKVARAFYQACIEDFLAGRVRSAGAKSRWHEFTNQKASLKELAKLSSPGMRKGWHFRQDSELYLILIDTYIKEMGVVFGCTLLGESDDSDQTISDLKTLLSPIVVNKRVEGVHRHEFWSIHRSNKKYSVQVSDQTPAGRKTIAIFLIHDPRATN